MDRDDLWPTFKSIIGRDPTRIEEELAIYLIRHGDAHIVEDIIFGRRPYLSAVRSLAPVEDLILSQWNRLSTTTQDLIRSQLRNLLWRIRGSRVSGTAQEAFRANHPKLDMDLIIRGIEHARDVWDQLEPAQRREIRAALAGFRRWAILLQVKQSR